MMPFYQLGAFEYPTAMALATLLGLGFGLALEGSGFGSSRILAAQFYGRDMRVFKVMFTAIVTATLGLGILGALGLADLAALKIPETFLGPLTVGGLLLGAGFVIAGYCPGTAVVATASGKLDGIAALVGVGLGSLVFAVFWPEIRGFYLSGGMGVVTLPALLGVSWAVVALLVTLMAVAMFFGAEWIETYFAKKDGDRSVATPKALRVAAVALGGVGLVGVAATAMPIETAPQTAPTVASLQPLELATTLAEADAATWLVDLRAPAVCAKRRIPGALCRPDGDTDGAFMATLPATRRLVVYGEGDLAALPAGALAFEGQKAVLAGGWRAFEAELLTAPKVPTDATAEQIVAYKRRAALHGWLTGAKTQAPVKLAAPRKITRKVRKGGGC